MDSKLTQAIIAFKARPAIDQLGLSDPDCAKGRCDGVAQDLFVFLHARGLRGLAIIQGLGLKTGLGQDCAREWKKFQGQEMCLGHVVVRAGRRVVDLTGRQFGSQYAPEIYPLKTFRQRWREVKEGPYFSVEAKSIREIIRDASSRPSP